MDSVFNLSVVFNIDIEVQRGASSIASMTDGACGMDNEYLESELMCYVEADGG